MSALSARPQQSDIGAVTESTDFKEMDVLGELASIMPTAASAAEIERIQRLAQEFADSHAWPHGPGRGKFVGEERGIKALLARSRKYIHLRVLDSAKKDDITGEPILDSEGRKVCMPFSELLSLASDFGTLASGDLHVVTQLTVQLEFFPVPRLSNLQFELAHQELYHLCVILSREYDLKMTSRDRAIIDSGGAQTVEQHSKRDFDMRMKRLELRNSMLGLRSEALELKNSLANMAPWPRRDVVEAYLASIESDVQEFLTTWIDD